MIIVYECVLSKPAMPKLHFELTDVNSCTFPSVAHFRRCSILTELALTILTILYVRVRIAVRRSTQGQSCGYTRKQLQNFVTINFNR